MRLLLPWVPSPTLASFVGKTRAVNEWKETVIFDPVFLLIILRF